MSTLTIASVEQNLANVKGPDESTIALGFFHKKKGDWVNLIEKEGAEVKVNEFDAEYSFSKPYLAHRVSIVGAEELKLNRFKVEVLNLNGSWVKLDGSVDSDDKNILHYDFSSFVVKLRITCFHGKNLDYLSKVRLKSVNIRGWAKDELDSLESACDAYFGIEAQVKKLAKDEQSAIASRNESLSTRETQVAAKEAALSEKEIRSKQVLEELSAKTKEATTELANREAELKKKTEESEKLSQGLSGLVEKRDQASKDLLDLESKTTEKKQELQTTLENISVKKSELQEISKDVSLFADDIKGFAQQGTAQIKRVTWGLLLPAIVVAGVMGGWSIFLTGEAYGDFIKSGGKLSVVDLLSFKVFSLLFVAAVLSFIYKFCHPFIMQIIGIDNKRLSLSVISILTQDTTDSATHDLDLDDDEKLSIRLKSRMALIREYLSGKFDTGNSDATQKLSAETLIKALVKESSSLGNVVPHKAIKDEKQKPLQ